MTLSKRQVKVLWKKYKTDSAGVKDDTNENEMAVDEEISEKIDVSTLRLRTELAPKINIQGLFDSTIDIIDMYYICAGCGHMYWVSKKTIQFLIFQTIFYLFLVII